MTQVKSRTARPQRKSPKKSWRVVDIVVAAVLAALCAVVFWAWANLLYPVATTAAVAYPPATGLIGGGWLIAGTLGALIIRKPGAAIFCELLAAVLEGFLGTHFGWTVVISGLVQGAAVELVFLLTRYRRFGLATAAAGGALAGLFMGVSENIMYNALWPIEFKVLYTVFAAISGVVIAGLLSWLATRGLARTGVLSSFAAGRTADV